MDLWLVLFPILLADIINPVLLTFLIFMAGTDRPVVNSALALLAHTLAYFASGVVIALGLTEIQDFFSQKPGPFAFSIEFMVGVFLIWLAFPSAHKSKKKHNEPAPEIPPWEAFMLGGVVCFVGVIFALPYCAAIAQIVKADLSVSQALTTLVLFNVLYALPFTAVPLLTAAIGARARPLLTRISTVMEKGAAFIIPVIFGLIGLALVLNSSFWFAVGTPLF